MFWVNLTIFSFVILHLNAKQLQRIVFNDAMEFCPNENTDIDNYLKFHMELIPSDDNEKPVVLNGNVTILKEFDKSAPIGVVFSCQIKKRGRWLELPYYMANPDFCSQAMNERGILRPFINHFKEELRVCPPIAKVPYIFDNMKFEISLDAFPQKFSEGDEYRIILKHNLKFVDGPVKLCYMLYGVITSS